MSSLYPIFLIVHLACAIIFLGFIFTDVVLFPMVKKALGQDLADKAFSAIVSRGSKIMPVCLILLLLSGGAMISQYVGMQKGFFENNLQILLLIKVALAFIIFTMVAFSMSRKIRGKKNPLANIIHPAALALGACIIVLAKLAFFV